MLAAMPSPRVTANVRRKRLSGFQCARDLNSCLMEVTIESNMLVTGLMNGPTSGEISKRLVGIPGVIYSRWRATAGGMRLARAAGIQVASRKTSARRAMLDEMLKGSSGAIP